MRCDYCGTEIIHYPANGICVHCGGKLPERPAGVRCAACGAYSVGNFCAHCGRSMNPSAPPVQPIQPMVQPVQPMVQPVYIPVQQTAPVPGVNCCPKCRDARLVYTTRGYSWGLGLLGFFLFSIFGLPLGFCGSKASRVKCTNCGHKWKRN